MYLKIHHVLECWNNPYGEWILLKNEEKRHPIKDYSYKEGIFV